MGASGGYLMQADMIYTFGTQRSILKNPFEFTYGNIFRLLYSFYLSGVLV